MFQIRRIIKTWPFPKELLASAKLATSNKPYVTMIFAPIMWTDIVYFHSFGKTARGYWFKRCGNHLGSSTLLLSFGVTFLTLPAIVMNSWWILVHEGSLKCLSWFRIKHLTIVIQRIVFEFEETCCIFFFIEEWLIEVDFQVSPLCEWTETIVIICLSCRCFPDRCKACLRVAFRIRRRLK